MAPYLSSSLTLLALAAFSYAGPTTDLGKPKIFERHIVAVGNINGNFDGFEKILRFSGVLDAKDHWSGKVDVFVQTGDITDRGAHMVRIYEKMDTLREEANSKDGAVVGLLGNHEWKNVVGDWSDVAREERLLKFTSEDARFKMLTTGFIGQSWKENYVTASRIPLHPFLGPPNTPYPSNPSVDESELSHSALSFVHGGLSPSYPHLTPFPTSINEIAASLLHRLQTRNPLPEPHPLTTYHGVPQDTPGLPKNTPAEERELYSGNGPVRYRGWAKGPEDQICEKVEAVLRKTGTRRMVMGHTTSDRIISRCNDRIIILNTRILSALSVRYSLTPVGYNANDPDLQVWTEREVIEALYEDSNESKILVNETRRVVGDFRTMARD